MRPIAGFTLIELVVTVAIISILAGILVPVSVLVVQREKEKDLKHALVTIRDSLDAYKKAVDEGRIRKRPEESGYPPSLRVLVDGVDDARDTRGGKLYFLRRIPRDPFHEDQSVMDERTWGIRSYDSSAEEPREGRDVYDVFSLSDRSGLNGVPYRQW